MKNNTKQNLDIFRNVIDVMENNLSTWNHVPKLKQTYDKFVKNYKKMEDAVKLSARDIKALEDKKQILFLELKQKIKPVTGVLKVWARDSGLKKVTRKLSLMETRFKSLNSTELLKFSGFILSATKNSDLSKNSGKKNENTEKTSAGWSEYGLTSEMLNDLRQASDSLSKIIEQLKEEGYERARALNFLKKRIPENLSLLKTRITKMVHLFRNSQPGFYEAYKNAMQPEKTTKQVKMKEKTVVEADSNN